MRTVYNGTNQNDNKQNNEVVIEKQEIPKQVVEPKVISDVNINDLVNKNKYKENLANAFIDINSQLMINMQEEESLKNEPSPDYGESSSYAETKKEEEKQEPKKKSKKKVVIPIVSVLGVLVISLVVLYAMGIINPFNSNKDTLKTIQSKTEMMYTDSLKSDVKEGYTESDIDALFLELKKIPEDSSTKEVAEELKTIQTFITDKNKVVKYADEEYDLRRSNELAISDCKNILNNAEGYSVIGLKTTISNLTSSVIEDWNEYILAESALKNVGDVISFNDRSAKELIEKVDHIPLREVLESLYEKVIADKDTAIAEQNIKKAKDEKEKKKAESALKKAQETQKEMMDKIKQLEDAINSTETETTVQPNSSTVYLQEETTTLARLEG